MVSKSAKILRGLVLRRLFRFSHVSLKKLRNLLEGRGIRLAKLRGQTYLYSPYGNVCTTLSPYVNVCMYPASMEMCTKSISFAYSLSKSDQCRPLLSFSRWFCSTKKVFLFFCFGSEVARMLFQLFYLFSNSFFWDFFLLFSMLLKKTFGIIKLQSFLSFINVILNFEEISFESCSLICLLFLILRS